MTDLGADSSELFDVFLSHSRDDWEIVQILAAKLEDEAKLRVWLDRWVLVPGCKWQQQMARGLDMAKTCAVCIGNNTPRGWFSEEIGRALNRHTNDESFRVIPILLPNGDPKNIEEFLELRTWVEFKDSISDDYAFHVLVSGIAGKSPGRYRTSAKSDTNPTSMIENLKLLKVLREGGLIDLEVAMGFQREILGPVIRRQGQ
jgi:hypothetical protein